MKQPNKSMIGFFILTGLAALIGMTLYLSGGRLFNSDKEQFVMYFNESVKGLNVGSPLVFEGVKVGEVSKIIIVANSNQTFSIPVFVRMDSQQKSLFGGGTGIFSYRREVMDSLIEKGLRARLSMQSFLTGQLMIELTMLPDTPINMQHTDNPEESYDDKVIEIPTVMSAAGALNKSLRDYPIGKTLESFNSILYNLNRQLPTFFTNADNLIKTVDKNVKSRSTDASIFMENTNKAAIEITGAARSMRDLVDYLERHPEALLMGKEETNE